MRRFISTVLLMTAGVAAGGGAAAAPPLAELQWKYRVIVSYAESSAQARSLSATFQHARGLSERDIAWFVVGPEDIVSNIDDRLDRKSLEAFHSSHGFQTVLIGKDGTLKRTQTDELDIQALLQAIDSMPMRQREMKR